MQTAGKSRRHYNTRGSRTEIEAYNTTKKYKVTWIDYGAFEDTEITSITLPNNY